MGRKQITLSPYGCTSCVHGWADRCGLTGHMMRYAVNAPHHCQQFKRNERVGGDPDRLASPFDQPYQTDPAKIVL